MFGDIRQGDSRLLRFGGPTMSCMHVPYRARHAGRVRNISVEVPVVPTANWSAVVIRHQGTTALYLRDGRERLLKQRIDCHIKHGPEVGLRRLKIEFARSEVLEPQTWAPDLASV